MREKWDPLSAMTRPPRPPILVRLYVRARCHQLLQFEVNTPPLSCSLPLPRMGSWWPLPMLPCAHLLWELLGYSGRYQKYP